MAWSLRLQAVLPFWPMSNHGPMPRVQNPWRGAELLWREGGSTRAEAGACVVTRKGSSSLDLEGVSHSALVLACLCTAMSGLAPVSAGPHAYGVILPHIAPGLEYSFGASYDGQSNLRDCEDAIVRGEVSSGEDEAAQIWYVMAAFPESPGPVDLGGIDFGFEDFDACNIEFVDHGPCNDGFLTLPSDSWPGPIEGVALLFKFARRTEVVEIYWFATYVYGPASIELGPDRTRRMGPIGAFVDTGVPPEEDEIYDYGILGFGEDGYNPYGSPDGDVEGACCVDDMCCVVSRQECEALGGDYQGDRTDCFPNPCRGEPIETHWWKLKRLYR